MCQCPSGRNVPSLWQADARLAAALTAWQRIQFLHARIVSPEHLNTALTLTESTPAVPMDIVFESVCKKHEGKLQKYHSWLASTVRQRVRAKCRRAKQDGEAGAPLTKQELGERKKEYDKTRRKSLGEKNRKELDKRSNEKRKERRDSRSAVVIAKAKAKRRKIYHANKLANIVNKLFPHDKVPDCQRKRPTAERFGNRTIVYSHVPQRLKSMEESITYNHGGLGHMEAGHFVENRLRSMYNVTLAMHVALFEDPRNRGLVTLDAGSGFLFPSVIMSQVFDQGFHPGIELCRGLASGSQWNLRELTVKGSYNINQGVFGKENVKKYGDLGYNVPPRAYCCHGDIGSASLFGLLC